MKQKWVEPEECVENFLKELKRIFLDEKFDLNSDLDILLKKKNEEPVDPFTTQNTLLALGFDTNDVLRELSSLEKGNYIETIRDNRGDDVAPFYVFGNTIDQRDVYIKIKIRSIERRKIFCVSFHFARFLFDNKSFPYEG